MAMIGKVCFKEEAETHVLFQFQWGKSAEEHWQTVCNIIFISTVANSPTLISECSKQHFSLHINCMQTSV